VSSHQDQESSYVDRQQAQQIAGSKASALLLEEYEVEVADEPE
jgi:hypothetical protein